MTEESFVVLSLDFLCFSMGKRYTNWIGTTKVPLRPSAYYRVKPQFKRFRGFFEDYESVFLVGKNVYLNRIKHRGVRYYSLTIISMRAEDCARIIQKERMKTH